ncbi:PACE efflux transporter [uncultured Desulfobacter sp.]|uniref:PACE efflux transporter n=1 Tax=uncultured Desulfobacter sp. TaxID=240139 RepID=UPI002AAA7AF3|nr:PACE efflux transporter [uncultured Desulfobacter sp.]
MNKKPAMRSNLDRLRHSIIFESVLLLLTVLILKDLFNQPATHIGGFGIVMSLMAMVWNYFYNCAFDHALIFFKHPLYPRAFKLRVFHTVCFEGGFMLVSVPFTMVWMRFTFIQALTMDIAFTMAVLTFTLVFNYAYDVIFPVPPALPD